MKSNGTTREPRLRILIPLVIGCAFFMEGLDSTMIAVAIPDMAESLGEHPLRLNLVITTYLLSLAVFIPLSGWIADRLRSPRLCPRRPRARLSRIRDRKSRAPDHPRRPRHAAFPGRVSRPAGLHLARPAARGSDPRSAAFAHPYLSHR